jgi:SM-20-related protein
VADRVLDSELCQALLGNLLALREDDRLQRAGIGRESDFPVRPDIRGDRIYWLSRTDAMQAIFLDQMERLRLALNQRLFLGLFEFEAHFAHYPEGAGYARHLDSFRGASNRLVSTVAYLNIDWQAGDGGELVLYAETGDKVVQVIEPTAGRLALFLSEEVPHEVLPARHDRFSIAGWFRVNNSIQGQIDPAR